MASSKEDWEPVVFLLPSLTHMSLVKITIVLQSAYGTRKLKKAFLYMESENSPESRENPQINYPVLNGRIKECLLLIPTNLRKAVFEIVERVEHQIVEWIRYHEKRMTFYYYPNFTFFWRSEGTIDRLKTAQEIVRTETIDARTRFEMACMYCLAENVLTLWNTFELNREELKTELIFFKDGFYSPSFFWITWLSQGAPCHWTEAATRKCLKLRFLYKFKLSILFRELLSARRRKSLIRDGRCLLISDKDDLRMCLYVVTKEEREEILRLYPEDILMAYSEWPLTDIFLEQADKTWEFLNDVSFLAVLMHLLDRRSSSDVETQNLAEEFWKRCPDHLKESVKLRTIHDRRLIEFIEKITHKNDG